MPKRTIVSIFLLPALIVVVFLTGTCLRTLSSLFGPSDDPALLCRQPDPSPLRDPSATLVLQTCAAGKTFTLHVGDEIEVDLVGSGDVDQSGTFHDLGVSDAMVLETVVAPNTIVSNVRDGQRGRFFDYFAVYKGLRPGQATITALLLVCNNAPPCQDTNRWRTTVRVV